MRGNSQPFGFTAYNEKNEVVVEVEDLCSLAKSFGTLIGILLLIEITQQIVQIVLFVLAFIYLVKMAREWSEWHAIEHKFAYLLENKLSLTMDNLKKASMQHERCGIGNKLLSEPSTRKMDLALKAVKG